MKHVKRFAVVLAVSAIFISCDKDNDKEYVAPPPPPVEVNLLTAAGAKDVIEQKIDQLRNLLGGPVNNAPGQGSGRREIGWDGTPVEFNNNNTFPLDFFNPTAAAAPAGRKRGLLYLNSTAPIRVDSSNFQEIDASYADEFIPFSGTRSLIAANTTMSEIVFKIAGTNTNGFVRGFGIVFLDVDNANSSSIECFNGNKSLGIFKAPVGGFSFVGVHFPSEKITRIKIVAGNAILAPGVKDLSDNGDKDLVAYDDFFYDEPKSSQ